MLEDSIGQLLLKFNIKLNIKLKVWRGGRVVERGGLENRYAFTGIGGSNPPLSESFCQGQKDEA